MSADALKVAEYARLWVLAEAAKREARSRFGDAMAALDGWMPGDADTPLIVSRLAGPDPFTGEWRSCWVYNAHALRKYPHGWPEGLAAPVANGFAGEDPRVIEQGKAWSAYRAAVQHAGNRRRVLTRTVNRLEAQRAAIAKAGGAA